MKELATYLARSLAGRPDEIIVADSVSEKGLIIELKVADEDINHLIGKQGRTVKAMRSLLAAAAAKSGQRFLLKISSNASVNGEDAVMEAQVPAEDEAGFDKDTE